MRGTREIERLGMALTTMARQRAAFDEQRRVMLMGVSHDLRSPLTRIRVAADLLDEQASTARPHPSQCRAYYQRHYRKLFVDYMQTNAEHVGDDLDLHQCSQRRRPVGRGCLLLNYTSRPEGVAVPVTQRCCSDF